MKKIETNHGQLIEFGYDYAGVLKTITHPNGKKTVFFYQDDALEHVRDPQGYETRYTYDDNYRITFEELKNGISYTCSYSNESERTLYDSQGNISVHIISADGCYRP